MNGELGMMLEMGDSFCCAEKATVRTDAVVRFRLGLLGLGVALFGLSCSADLHEIAGPLVPVPNLRGQVLREGIPAVDLRVRLQDTDGKTLSSQRTDGDGRYGFTEVDAGDWSVRVESGLASDFAQVTQTVTFFSADTSATLSSLEIGLGELQVLAPADSAAVPVPGFFSPLSFTSEGSAGRKQVRFFEASTAGGASIWYSVSNDADLIRWNGLGTESGHVGVPVSAGEYRWRLRLEGPRGLESLTQYRHITLVP